MSAFLLSGCSSSDELSEYNTFENTVIASFGDSYDSETITGLVSELKIAMSASADYTDDELRIIISDLAAEYGMTLTEAHVTMLIELCRMFEKLSVEDIQNLVTTAKDFIITVYENKDKIVDVIDKTSDFVSDVTGDLNEIFSSDD